jgi:hypothetical protein|tara:strand:+ start:903 stop:1220 length:318 start_codon:yes stop_codon:yes gene_type:complete
MNIIKVFNKICTPAQLYLAISLVAVISILIQNCEDNTVYRVGDMVVKTPCHNLAFFAVKVLYIILWTWLLNLLCKKGFSGISWLLVLLPIVGMFVMIGMVFLLLQ